MFLIHNLKKIKDFGITKKVVCLVLALICVVSIVMTGTKAWQDFIQHRTNIFSMSVQPSQITLRKYEKDINGQETTTVVQGAEFYLFREEGNGTLSQIGERYTTDRNGMILVYGLSEGNYYFLETNPTYDYTYDQNENGKEITKYFFTIAHEDAEKGEMIEIKAYNRKRYAGLEIMKTVINGNGSPLNQEQKDFLFEFKVTFSDHGTYRYSIDSPDNSEPSAEQEIASGGIIYLKHGQIASIKELPVGVQYTVSETPVTGYSTNSTNSIGNITREGAKVSFENRYDADIEGSLEISKQVTGEDISREFAFTVTFSDDGTYTYHMGDGEEQSLVSGRSILLKHGETAVFDGLPAGLGFTITEEEAEGYIAGIKKVNGNIVSGSISKANFQNFKGQSNVYFGSLEISKQVSGNGANMEKEFLFNLSFSDDGAYTYKVNNGEEQSLADGTLSLRHGETAIFDNVPAGVTYTITEEDYSTDNYIASVDEISGVIAEGGVVQADFHNYRIQKVEEATLTVKKLVQGEIPEGDTDKEFSFTVIIDGEKTSFKLKNGEEKIFTLPAGVSYEVLELDYFADGYVLSSIIGGSGTAAEQPIECIVVNAYIGIVSIAISGQKKWDMASDPSAAKPESITLKLKDGDRIVGIELVRPDENDRWNYSFMVPKYDQDGKEITYTLEEDPVEGFQSLVTGADILNTYIRSVDYRPIVKKTVSGDEPDTLEAFTFRLSASDNAPMPETDIVTILGEGKARFGNIRFTKVGTYTYTIVEIKGETEGYIYDETVYTLTVVVEADDNKLIIRSTAYTKAGSRRIYRKAVFTNTFEKRNITSVKVTKVWMGKYADQPQSIQVQLYKNGTVFGEAVTLNDSNHWTHIWTGLDKQASWTVDEPSVPEGYTRVVVNDSPYKFTIINVANDDPADDITEEQITVSGIKKWQHGLNPKERQPKSIKVFVKCNGTAVVQAVVTEADHWYWNFDLPKYDSQGREIQYTIEEEPVSGYTAKYDGYNITNTHETYAGIEVTGQKIWNHGSNLSKQPDSIIVYVKNGDKVIATQKVTAVDGWSYSFSLPKYDENGKEIKYTVNEENVPYYTHTVNGYDIINTFTDYDYPGDSPQNGDTPKTGDSSNIWICVIFMITSLIALIILYIITFCNKDLRIGS